MRKLFLSALTAIALMAPVASADELTGVITCAKCRHKDAAQADCAKTCIKNGTGAIFISSADGKVYTITNPDKIGDAVNENVKVDATVEGDKITLNSVTSQKS